MLAQGELRAHLGGVLQEANVRARLGYVQGLHNADDKLLDQLKVGRAHALGAIDHEDQIHDSVTTRRPCRKRQRKLRILHLI